MNQAVPRPRRFARRIFVLLLILTAIGAGLWWQFFRLPGRQLSGGGDLLRGGGATGALVQKFEEERPIMGTLFKIVLYAADEAGARAAMAEAFARGEEIDAICTDYDPRSELSLLNARQGPAPVPLSSTLAAILAHAREMADATDGLFDPTLGTLTQLWRQSRDTQTLPDDATLAAARAATGWKHLTVDLDESTAQLSQPGLKLDLGGIGKGFAADEMLAVLTQRGFSHALIAAGGDIRLGNPPPGSLTWRVGLRTFGPDVPEFISVTNCAVSTSGDLHQFVEIEGKRYSHIIDPATGLGLRERIAATVIAPTATQSDPLATFCCIAPESALAAFIGGDVACRIVTIKGLTPEDRRSPHFPRVDSR